MQRIWYKEAVPGFLLKQNGGIVLVDLYVNGIWMKKYVQKSHISNRIDTISPYIVKERLQWYNEWRNSSKS